MRTIRLKRAIVAGLGAALLVGATVYAATSTIHGVGTIAYFQPFDGPATMTVRSLFIEANEVLSWHEHPGIGAYTIVKTGTLTVEDGCGDEIVYPQGTAFVEPAGRVHRGKAGDVAVETVQTFVVPVGTPFSTNVPQACGAPLVVEECRGDGWFKFNHPRTFSDEGDCINYVTGVTPAACPTIKPGPDWLCINGGWVPPGHPLAAGRGGGD